MVNMMAYDSSTSLNVAGGRPLFSRISIQRREPTNGILRARRTGSIDSGGSPYSLGKSRNAALSPFARASWGAGFSARIRSFMATADSKKEASTSLLQTAKPTRERQPSLVVAGARSRTASPFRTPQATREPRIWRGPEPKVSIVDLRNNFEQQRNRVLLKIKKNEREMREHMDNEDQSRAEYNKGKYAYIHDKSCS